MARREVHVCDARRADGPCGRPAESWNMWRTEDRQARQIDLCDEHAAPLVALMNQAELVDLPVRPRAKMQATRLKPTPRTAPLKMRRDPDGSEGSSPRP